MTLCGKIDTIFNMKRFIERLKIELCTFKWIYWSKVENKYKRFFPKDDDDYLRNTFGPIDKFLVKRGWVFDWINFTGWTDYKTNKKYPNSLLPYFIESDRIDSERSWYTEYAYGDDTTKVCEFLKQFKQQ